MNETCCARCGVGPFFIVPERRWPDLCSDCAEDRASEPDICAAKGCTSNREGGTVWCPEHMTGWTRAAVLGEPEPEGGCNTLFCVLGRHDDDRHVDATGYSWREPLSDRPVIARSYSF